jgi:hypothetical protein
MHATLYLTPAATVKVAQDRVTRWLAIEDGGSRLDVFLGHTPEETIAACDLLGAAIAECREAAARRLAARGIPLEGAVPTAIQNLWNEAHT